jgi:hypothetical protein
MGWPAAEGPAGGSAVAGCVATRCHLVVMDYPSIVINVAALCASVAAVSFSVVLAKRQTAITTKANQVPVILGYFRELRTNGFVVREFRVQQEIAAHDPALGFAGLPDPIRIDAYEVCFYYLDLAYMIKYGGVYEELLANFGFRMVKTWDAVKEHVEGERKNRNSGSDLFLGSLEALVERVRNRGDYQISSAPESTAAKSPA